MTEHSVSVNKLERVDQLPLFPYKGQKVMKGGMLWVCTDPDIHRWVSNPRFTPSVPTEVVIDGGGKL